MPGGAGVLPPVSNATGAPVQMSPGKKTRGGAAGSGVAPPNPTSVGGASPMFSMPLSMPLMPSTVPHPLTTAEALSYYPPRPSADSLEHLQRSQLLHRQMLLAAGQQLTPVSTWYSCSTAFALVKSG